MFFCFHPVMLSSALFFFPQYLQAELARKNEDGENDEDGEDGEESEEGEEY